MFPGLEALDGSGWEKQVSRLDEARPYNERGDCS